MRFLRSLLRKAFATGTALILGAALFGSGPGLVRAENPASPKVFLTIPKEAKDTLAFIRAHGEAPPDHVGGRRFGNYGQAGEQKLPQLDALGKPIEYREWDIHPKVAGRNRGAERLVTGSAGRAWFTADHYTTFTEIT